MTKPTESEMVLAAADIAGFAKACRDKSDVQMFEMLERFQELVGKVVTHAGGTVVKFMGDCAFMVFPGNEAKQAVAALHELKAGGENLWTEFGSACGIRVHAHIGRVASGPMGPDQRFDVVGMSVNDLFMMPWDGPELSASLKQIMAKQELSTTVSSG